MLNAFNIERLALELKSGSNSILDKRLVDAFTTDKYEIYLVFEHLAIKLIFFNGEAFFQFPDKDKLQKKNRLTVFTNLIGQRVSEIIIHPYDRIFRIRFKNRNELAFLLFGRFSQVIQYQGEQLVAKFPVKSKDFAYDALRIKDAKTIINQSTESVDWLKELRFLSVKQKEVLTSKINGRSSLEQKVIALEEIRADALKSPLFVCKSADKYVLMYEPKGELISSLSDIVQALDQHARLFIAHQVFKNTKSALLAKLNKEFAALKRKLASLRVKEKSLLKAGSYKKMANLLMANLYHINKGEKEVTLLDFDGENEVSIKLKSDLSPQANAERYYKKAKNEGKQLDFLLKTIVQTEIFLESKEAEIQRVTEENDFKILKKGVEKTQQKVEVRLPFKRMEIDGYEIRIGKGAKDNDELIRQYAAKNDIWLHAKDVSGSHVVIHNPSKKPVPLSTIEKVAEIAAFYSKAKTDTLAAVIYTERKFVRKPKKANPGAVIVEKEEVILVEPRDLHST